jgi:hypothetical protein
MAASTDRRTPGPQETIAEKPATRCRWEADGGVMLASDFFCADILHRRARPEPAEPVEADHRRPRPDPRGAPRAGPWAPLDGASWPQPALLRGPRNGQPHADRHRRCTHSHITASSAPHQRRRGRLHMAAQIGGAALSPFALPGFADSLRSCHLRRHAGGAHSLPGPERRCTRLNPAVWHDREQPPGMAPA